MTGKEIAKREVLLPAGVREEARLARESPAKYYACVKAEGVEDEREPNALTIFSINRGLERARALMLISLALIEVKEWFNVKGNMNDRQIALTAELILDHPHFYDLSLGNIKACFRERMMSEKVYDRIDGNIIIGWLKRFKSEMADACYRQNVERDREERLRESGEWRGLDGKVDSEGNLSDEKAERRTLNLTANLPPARRVRTREEQEKWERDFMRYRAEYLLKKRNERERERDV